MIGQTSAVVCCGQRQQLTVSDYVDAGWRRMRAPVLPISGAVCRDDDGRAAGFSVRVECGVITGVAFKASACATLIAFCEGAARRAMGHSPSAAAQRVVPTELIVGMPSVPPIKRARAVLASRALIATLTVVVQDARA